MKNKLVTSPANVQSFIVPPLLYGNETFCSPVIKIKYLIPVLANHFIEQQIFHHCTLRLAQAVELIFSSHAKNSFVLVAAPIKGELHGGNVVEVTSRVTDHPDGGLELPIVTGLAGKGVLSFEFDRQIDISCIIDLYAEYVRPATNCAVFGVGLCFAAGRIDKSLVLLSTERAQIENRLQLVHVNHPSSLTAEYIL